MKSIINVNKKHEIFSSILNLLVKTDPPFRTPTTRELYRLMKEIISPNEITQEDKKEILNSLKEIIMKIKSMKNDEKLSEILFQIFEK